MSDAMDVDDPQPGPSRPSTARQSTSRPSTSRPSTSRPSGSGAAAAPRVPTARGAQPAPLRRRVIKLSPEKYLAVKCRNDLVALQTRREILERFQPLRGLALRQITTNFDYDGEFYAEMKGDPFYLLREADVKAIQEHKPLKKKLRKPHIARIFITKSMRRLDIDCVVPQDDHNDDYEWTRKNIKNLMKRVKVRCAERITEVYIRLNFADFPACSPQVTTKDLNDILECMPRLRVLSVTGYGESNSDPSCDMGVTDETLEILAEKCTRLRSLVIGHQCQLSKHALLHLFTRCKMLESLNFLPPMHRDVLKAAITRLPNLRELVNKDAMASALEYAATVEEDAPPKQLKINLKLKDDTLTPENIAQIAKVFPNAHILYLDDPDTLETFTGFKNLENLKIEYDDDENEGEDEAPPTTKFDKFPELLGNSLTKLEVTWGGYCDKPMDVSVIGHHCPELVELTLRAEFEQDGKYRMQPEHFSKLKKLHLISSIQGFFGRKPVPPTSMNNYELFQLLSGPNLEKVRLSNIELGETIVRWLIEEAKTRQQVFSCVKKLELYDTRATNETIVSLLCQMPRLKTFDITDDDRKIFKSHRCLSHFLQKFMRHLDLPDLPEYAQPGGM